MTFKRYFLGQNLVKLISLGKRDFPQKTNESVFNKKLKNCVDCLALIKSSKEIR